MQAKLPSKKAGNTNRKLQIDAAINPTLTTIFNCHIFVNFDALHHLNVVLTLTTGSAGIAGTYGKRV